MKLVFAVMIALLSCSLTDTAAALTVTPPSTKPWQVTELTADTPGCDSTTTYAYNVTWKPVFITWDKVRAPFLWTHYAVDTRNCKPVTQITCGPMCTAKVTGCDINTGISWARVFTYKDDEQAAAFGFPITISGMTRPATKVVNRKLLCVGK